MKSNRWMLKLARVTEKENLSPLEGETRVRGLPRLRIIHPHLKSSPFEGEETPLHLFFSIFVMVEKYWSTFDNCAIVYFEFVNLNLFRI
jgi:hypothetical protein